MEVRNRLERWTRTISWRLECYTEVCEVYSVVCGTLLNVFVIEMENILVVAQIRDRGGKGEARKRMS